MLPFIALHPNLNIFIMSATHSEEEHSDIKLNKHSSEMKMKMGFENALSIG